jgi:hypothetical protein
MNSFVRFTIWVTKTEFNFDIIGGIAIEYLNGRNVMFGKERTDSSENSVHTFTLDDNEFITKVILGTTDHLHKITFFSNFGKTVSKSEQILGIHLAQLSTSSSYISSSSGTSSDEKYTHNSLK